MERKILNCSPYALLLCLSLVTLDCAARQVRNDSELEQAVQRASANEEKGWQALERTIHPKDEEPDLEIQKRAVSEVGKITSPRAVKILAESANNRYLRGESVAGLLQQRTAENRDQINQIILNAARYNAQEYGGLTKEEIRALGEIDDPQAVLLLKQQLGRDPTKDELVIESLGKILRRQKRSSIHLPSEPKAQVVALLLFGAQLQFEDISSYASEPQTASAITEPNATGAAVDVEKILLDYLASDALSEVKDKAAESIAEAHGGGYDYLLNLAGQNSLPVKARIAIIDYLTRRAVDNQEKSMLTRFAALKRRSTNRDVTASIDLSIRILAKAFDVPMATTSPRPRRVIIEPGYDPLPKEADIITLKQRPYPEYSSADVKTNLKKMLRHYQLGEKLADRMQQRVKALLNQPENKHSSERNLIFAALARLYPQKDFYVLKEQGQDAFSKPGYFTTTLRLITSSARGRSWQIAALQRVWDLSYAEADTLRQIYLRDGKLLQQRMRL